MNVEYMGYFDPVTGDEFEGPPAPASTDSGGLTEQGASVLTGLFNNLASVANTIIGATTGGSASSSGATGTPQLVLQQPAAAAASTAGSNQAMMLLAIGIPAALVAIALMSKGRR